MSLYETLLHPQTFFALFIYCITVIIAIPMFELIHEKFNNYYAQYIWDRVGAPLLRTFFIIIFILLVYPINFGIEQAPTITELLSARELRLDFLVNIIFLLTFLFPLIPIFGRLEELIIPIQGILGSMIIFNWLCMSQQIEDYTLFPDLNVYILIILISLITHYLARYISDHVGQYFDTVFDREGFNVLVLRCVLLIMQCPVIFIFSLSLGKQLH